MNNKTGSSDSLNPTSVPTDAITSFKGDFAFLSNFYPSVIYVGGLRYETVEHAYQAAKTTTEEHRELIRNAKTAGQAKKLGRTIPVRNDWNEAKVDVMRKLVQKKFENPFLRPLLKATGDAPLVEVNYWHDSFWGTYKGEGENWLGKLLMETRAEIKDDE